VLLHADAMLRLNAEASELDRMQTAVYRWGSQSDAVKLRRLVDGGFDVVVSSDVIYATDAYAPLAVALEEFILCGVLGLMAVERRWVEIRPGVHGVTHAEAFTQLLNERGVLRGSFSSFAPAAWASLESGQFDRVAWPPAGTWRKVELIVVERLGCTSSRGPKSADESDR